MKPASPLIKAAGRISPTLPSAAGRHFSPTIAQPATCATISQPQARASQIARHFSTTKAASSKNRVYTSIRAPHELHDAILLSTSSRTPLLTYWSASYCPPCKVISPLIKRVVSSDTPPCPADPSNKIAFAEVEFDAPDIMGSTVPMDYMVNSLPSLLVFDRGEVVARETDSRKMSNETWLREWIEEQGKRKGQGTGGNGGGRGFLGGLFGL